MYSFEFHIKPIICVISMRLHMFNVEDEFPSAPPAPEGMFGSIRLYPMSHEASEASLRRVNTDDKVRVGSTEVGNSKSQTALEAYGPI